MVRPYKIVIAPDSFKGSLSAQDVAKAIQNGVDQAFPNATTVLLPLADGGEGTIDVLETVCKGQRIFCDVVDPLFDPIKAEYLLCDDGCAIIEMAKASGLTLVQPDKHDPSLTTTYGCGQLIKDALDHGATKLIITLGGSATNDGGCGALNALGVCFYDIHGQTIVPVGGNLDQIKVIDDSSFDPRLRSVPTILLADVTNPLCGPNGASCVYGPQKGADHLMIQRLDHNLDHLSKVVESKYGINFRDVSGSGAAGGLAFGLMSFCGATIQNGIDTILDLVHFDQVINDADLVITGEGKMDGSSLNNKVAIGVAKAAKRVNNSLTVIAICGCYDHHVTALNEKGIDAIFSISTGSISQEESVTNASYFLTNQAKQIARLIKSFYMAVK